MLQLTSQHSSNSDDNDNDDNKNYYDNAVAAMPMAMMTETMQQN